MYVILSDGAVLALCDKPRYVRLHDNGSYVEAAEADATGLAVSGNLYNIHGRTDIAGAPQAIVLQRDIAEYVFQNRTSIRVNDVETKAAIGGAEEALCELDATTDQRLTDVENALCELDGIIHEGGTTV